MVILWGLLHSEVPLDLSTGLTVLAVFVFFFFYNQDPQETLKEKCREESACQKYIAELEKCTERVESRTHTEETCVQELYDMIHCVDHCVGGCAG